MAQVRQGRTTLLIAYRLSTISSADRVVLLGNGVMLDAGTHEELLQRSSSYATLLASQDQDGRAVVRIP